MKKKYYYDCPIQALYMMKEFGVEFFIKDDDVLIGTHVLKSMNGIVYLKTVYGYSEITSPLRIDNYYFNVSFGSIILTYYFI